MDPDRVSLALTPPWRGEQLLLVRATDAVRRLRDGSYQEVPPEQAIAEVAALSRSDMMSVRTFVASARLTAFPLPMLDHHKVLTLLTTSIRQRELVALCPAAAIPGGETDARTEQRQLVRQIEAKAPRGLSHEGRRYRLVADADLAKVRDRDSYEVVPHRDAVVVLRAIAGQPGGTNDLGPLLVEVSTKLAADWRPPGTPDGLVLLRRLKIVAAAQIEAATPITPSQMKQMLQPSAIIEIELTDADGVPVAGEAWEVVLPDGSKRSGQLDADGYAKVTSIPEGTCQVTFPGLDADAWGPG